MSDKSKKEIDETPDDTDSPEMKTRREFLRSLGKWSLVIMGAAGASSLIDPPPAAGWVNGRGGAWVNGRGGGGGWVNRSGGGGWVNRSGGGSWVNRSSGGGAWVNGGGGAWVNSRGGWINRY